MRAISNVRAPVPPAGLARKTCHDSPHQAVRLFVSRLPKRPGSLTTAPEPPIWSAAQVSGLPTLRTSPVSPSDGDDRDRADEAANDLAPPARDEALDRDESHERRGRRRRRSRSPAPSRAPSETRSARAPPSSTRAGRVNAQPRHEDRGAGRKQRQERRLDPLLAEAERERDNREPGEEAGAGLGEEDHERGRVEEQRPRGAAEAVAHRGDEPEAEAERSAREERERVPVADRSLQSRDAPRIVRAERRDRPCRGAPRRGRRRAGRRGAARASARAARAGRRPRGRRRRRRGGRVPCASASQERSPAIDHHTVSPVHATSAITAAPATVPARSRRGRVTRPSDQPTISRAATMHGRRPERCGRARPRGAAGEERPARGGRRRPRARRRRGLIASRVGPRPWRATVPPRRPVPVAPRLTIRLPCTHRRLNGSRETCHTPRQPLLCPPAPCIDLPLLIAPCGSASRSSSVVLLSAPRERPGPREGEVVRGPGDRRLVRRRPRRQDLSARVLPPGDQELPPDVLDYSNAKEEIGRALAFAKQGKPDPGGEDPTPPATTSTTTRRRRRRKTSTTKTTTTKTTRPRRTRPTRTRPTRARPTRARPTRPGRRRYRCRCSCSEGSRCCSSRPARPAISAAGWTAATTSDGTTPAGRRRTRRRHAADHD